MPSRLQAEIKQTRPFPWVGTEAMLGVLRTAAVVTHAIERSLRPFGLTLTQANVLRILRGAGKSGICGREVGERLVAKVPDVSRLLDRMVEQGLIERARDESDRRHVTARISTKGLKLLDQIDPILDEVARERFGSLKRDELRDLVSSLDAVRAAGDPG
jgi:DNA-binding MarR family transcriptional regulator